MAEKSRKKTTVDRGLLPVEVAIGLVTVPALITLVGAKAFADTVQNLGQWSEELFRGDRLPMLNVPPSTPSDT